jgi:anti-sigma regulatory factor (Ser/Thr protein kinase)
MQLVRDGCERSFAPVPGEIAEARRWARDCLRRFQWPPAWDGCAEAVVLAVSELVTNTHVHARRAARVGLAWDGRRLLVAVSDSSADRPLPRRTAVGTPGGYGLPLVGLLARTWGITVQPLGKSVWALFQPC